MKKETFLDLVCERLSELSLDAREIEKQRAHIDKYLSNLGIEDESEELDDEDPNEFAEDIYEVMLENGAVAGKPESVVDAETAENEDESESDVDDDDDDDVGNNVSDKEESEENAVPAEDTDDIIVTVPPKKSENDFVEAETRTDIAIPRRDFGMSGTETENTEDASDSEPPYTDEELEEFYESEGLSDEDLGGSPDEIVATAEKEAEEDATREFGVSDIELEEIKRKAREPVKRNEDDEDEFDYYEEALPEIEGNPVLFHVLTVLLSPVWIALSAVAVALVAVCYTLIFIFKVLYMPLIVVSILGGSAVTLAEAFYGITRIAAKNTYVGLLEIGIGLIAASIAVLLVVLIYKLGVDVSPKAFKKFGKFLRRSRKKLKIGIMKLKGACCI